MAMAWTRIFQFDSKFPDFHSIIWPQKLDFYEKFPPISYFLTNNFYSSSSDNYYLNFFDQLKKQNNVKHHLLFTFFQKIVGFCNWNSQVPETLIGFERGIFPIDPSIEQQTDILSTSNKWKLAYYFSTRFQFHLLDWPVPI